MILIDLKKECHNVENNYCCQFILVYTYNKKQCSNTSHFMRKKWLINFYQPIILT